MTAEIVVIVEYQDARPRIDIATMDVCGGQTTDPRADDDKVVVLAGFLRGPALTLHRRVGHFERTRVGTAHAGCSRRIV